MKFEPNCSTHVIRNDEELEHFTEMLLTLDEVEKPSGEQKELAELLTALIERYEGEHYALPKATPKELSRFLLEQRGQPAKARSQKFAARGKSPPGPPLENIKH